MSRTNVALVIDNSGSMAKIREEVLDAANSILSSLASNPDTYVSVITFGESARVIRNSSFAGGVAKIGCYRDDYGASESFTAIFEGLELADRTLSDLARTWAPDDAFLVILITDGENNAGHAAAARAPRTIQRLQDTGKWTLVFQLPQGKADAFSKKFGVPRENCEEWEVGTERGIRDVEEKTSAGIASYYAERSTGATRSTTFFKKVNANLGWLDRDELRRQLPDLSGQFKKYPVGSEQDIRDFVRAKTGRDLVIGSAYYQLTKEEKIQGDKRILVRDKGTGSVFGGNGARQLVGLPIDGTHAKVTPGNLGNFDIFVQSKSVNRRLVRGTNLLIDTEHRVGSVPTWDHTAGSQR